jgi:prepilin-type N-terminal cleavage/methylation domain-containing protein
MQFQFNKSGQNGSHRAGAYRRAGKRQRAFTLAEIMVTVFVLGVVCLSLFAGFSTGFMMVDSARQDLRASQILTQKAEAIRLCTWSSLSNCPISFIERYDPSSTNSAGTVYSGTVTTSTPTIIPNTASYRTNMLLVTISLSWTNYSAHQSAAHSRTAQTLVARYGMQNYIWGTTP